jgi:hypothetical protein
VADPTHIYKHPDNHGLGRHHAGEDISNRVAQPDEVQQSMRTALDMVGADDSQRQRVEHFVRRTMDDLDMPDGQQVYDVPADERFGPNVDEHEVVWTDKHGDPRRTHISDEQWEQFFHPIEQPAEVTS